MKIGDLVEFKRHCGKINLIGVIIGVYSEYPEGKAWRIKDTSGENWVYFEKGLRVIG
jgi:hypothetical protein